MSALAAAPLAASSAQQHPVLARQQQAADLAARDRAIVWPRIYDPARAAQFSHNALLVRAPCDKVFAVMADATTWSKWLVFVKGVRVLGPVQTLSAGRTLSLSIFGGPITSTITEWVPGERMAWIPKSTKPSGSDHYHAWHFVPAGRECRVVTEEVGIGPADRAVGANGGRMMHRAHDLWLASLRYASE